MVFHISYCCFATANMHNSAFSTKPSPALRHIQTRYFEFHVLRSVTFSPPQVLSLQVASLPIAMTMKAAIQHH